MTRPRVAGDLLRPRLRLAQGLAGQHHLGAERLGVGDLEEGGVLGHDDSGGNAEPRRVIGDGLGVIAGRHGDHAAARLLGAERGELHQRAAVLERVGELQILELEIDLGPGQRRELRRGNRRGADHMVAKRRLRRLDFSEADFGVMTWGGGGDRHR